MKNCSPVLSGFGAAIFSFILISCDQGNRVKVAIEAADSATLEVLRCEALLEEGDVTYLGEDGNLSLFEFRDFNMNTSVTFQADGYVPMSYSFSDLSELADEVEGDLSLVLLFESLHDKMEGTEIR